MHYISHSALLCDKYHASGAIMQSLILKLCLRFTHFDMEKADASPLPWYVMYFAFGMDGI